MCTKKRSLAADVQNNLIRLARFSVFCLDRHLISGVPAKMFEAARSSKKESQHEEAAHGGRAADGPWAKRPRMGRRTSQEAAADVNDCAPHQACEANSFHDSTVSVHNANSSLGPLGPQEGLVMFVTVRPFTLLSSQLPL